MKPFVLPLIGMALLLPGAALAQPDRAPSGAGTPPAAEKAPGNSRAMYEDIEIMRRLIGRSVVSRAALGGQCSTCHSVVSHGAQYGDMSAALGVKGHGAAIADFDSDGWADLFLVDGHSPYHGVGGLSIEGSYLKGHGVVYHLTLPAQAQSELTPSGPAPPAMIASEWEQVRRQLRGDPETKAAPAKKATLVDALLRVLADHGKNFGLLPANENLTVIVTFRDDIRAKSSSLLMGSGLAPMMGAAGGGMAAGPMGGGPKVPMGAAAPPGGAGPGGGEGVAAGGEPTSPDRELELLGDLHLKRGNLNDAASAFERALNKARETPLDPAIPRDQSKAATDRANERLAHLVRKLAETHLRMNNLDAARKALDGATIKLTTPVTKPTARQVVPAMKLPGKLSISVPKRVLDQVGASSITIAEFQKQVTINVPVNDQKQ